jgi:hypothetical protein
MAHQNASRRSAKQREITAAAPSPPAGDADDHRYALVQTRVSERAKIELARRMKVDGMPETVYVRRVLYLHLGIPVSDQGTPDEEET